MNRKHFLSSLAAALPAPAPLFARTEKNPSPTLPLIVPPYLRQGDTIGITCPAGFIMPNDIQPAVEQMESWGFRIKLGATVGKRDFNMGGSDDDRAADLQQMLDDPSIKAIMCARGGYGMIHIIDRLSFDKLKRHPKWIIGFSDVTVLHCHLYRHTGMASIHSKMCNSFPDSWSEAEPIQQATILSIKEALEGQKMRYTALPNARNRKGEAKGRLVGGNLSLIDTLTGTRSDLDTTGKILFVEDTGEYLYSLDKMFWHFERTGKLTSLRGLIVGGFKVKPDDPGEEFGHDVYDIVWDRVKNYRYPVCFDFPVGHQKNNFALKCGIVHKLAVGDDGAVLTEIR